MDEPQDRPIRRPVPPERIPKPRTPKPPSDKPGPGAIPKKAGEGLITEEDIRAYFTTHEFMLGPTVSGEPPTVVDVKFMTSKACSDMLYTWITSVDSRPICYVKLRGPFLFARRGPPPRDGERRPASTVEYGEEVFDAVSGNLLMCSPGATV